MNTFPALTNDLIPADRARFELFINVFVRNPQPVFSRRRVSKR